MNVLHRKPTKLTLKAYSDREMTQLSGTLSAMYNPDSVSLDYQTDYRPDLFINTTRQSNRYVQTRPGGLTLELLFDARMPGNHTPIDRQLTRLRSLCYNVNPADSEPRYLQVRWGKMRWNGRGYFSGRMSSLSIRYTLFERDATPLRATATLVLTADGSLTLQSAEEQLKAPASAVVNVPDATSLAQVTNSAASTLTGATDYLEVAAENDLDSLDAIRPGQTLKVSAAGKGTR
ncbi:hypothetical protein AYM40_06195 [Paraburkholderia phytofirmans OLGA172]|uniref:Contractile injection system tube protein N-terminal domain-containing protein n=1 Tax=Paraburkholderia phytofirmans OLGA172 TaxID=1417228 RepID=A0A160FIM0_9BURK|nr:hypothetical protein [Paraburkholderia phytofirmans]ANB72005.1 hypothetical protein AYM40_06195 [Paraburkholderia phytofirmans OLGA172]